MTHFDDGLTWGPTKTGSSASPDYGFVAAWKYVDLTPAAGTDVVATTTLVLPAGALITYFAVDNSVVSDAGTSATLSLGSAAAGTQYFGSLNGKTATRLTPVPTSTQALVWQTVSTAQKTLHFTSTGSGAATTGTHRLYVCYVKPVTIS